MPNEKVFRDPLYNYISIDLDKDRWLLSLLDTPELQRLRRIHQLGISYYTYPGADHNRIAHSLGVLHVMNHVLAHLAKEDRNQRVATSRKKLLAAALLHDVGHGPFSHVFEPCLGVDHEEWSVKAVRDQSSSVYKVLSKEDPDLPESVAKLIEKNNVKVPLWEKALLSSQLDVDRVDYLRRDSLYTGAGYGHFDWHRLMSSVQLWENNKGNMELVWPEKAAMAIEEYIFARYYMYQNVYLHKTTRGFEEILKAMWRYARNLHNNDSDAQWVPTLKNFFTNNAKNLADYFAIEEFTVLSQIDQWKNHEDKSLADLARRFLCRDGFAAIDPPAIHAELDRDYREWEDALYKLVQRNGYEQIEMYCLCDTVKSKYRQPYFPEKEEDEQSMRTAIRVLPAGTSSPVEISKFRDTRRIASMLLDATDRRRYYVPKEVRAEAKKLADSMSK